MRHIEKLSEETVNTFLRDHVAPGASLIVPDSEPYLAIDKSRYLTVVRNRDCSTFHIEEILQCFALWLSRIHRGGVMQKHLQLYLDEFCFRANAAMLPNAEAVFHLLLTSVLQEKPRSYKILTSSMAKE